MPTYPCIIVEHPHQRPARAWIARDEDAICDTLAAERYGENWDREEYANLSHVIESYGEDREDWPDALRETTAADYPLIHFSTAGGDEVQPAATAQSELDFALEYIGHDLNGLTILESVAEAKEYLAKPPSHRPAIDEVMESAIYLGWLAEDAEDEEDEEDEED